MLFLVTILFLLSSPGQVASAPVQTSAPATQERERGTALYRQGKAAEAVSVLKKVVKKNSADYESWHILGLALIQRRDLKNATKSFEAALKLNPTFARAHVGLSYALVLRNKSGDAMREAEEALKIDPSIADAHYLIAVVHLRAGAREEALKKVETALKLNPQFAAAYLLKSQALVRFLGDAAVLVENQTAEDRHSRYIEAAAALEKFLELNPNAEEKETWVEQLESLRFYGGIRRNNQGDDRVYTGKEVRSKARVLSKPEPVYTDEARANLVEGTVVLRAIFAADGTVRRFLIVKGLPHGLTENAIRAARRIKFVPAMVNGRPVSMFIQLEYNFNLY